MTRSRTETIAITKKPRLNVEERQTLLNAEDGDFVAISTRTFVTAKFLHDGQGSLSKADRAFWTETAGLRGKIRRQTAFVALGVVGGELYVLDGAKRLAAWRDGLARAPGEVYATVHQLLSLAQARRVADAYGESQTIERGAETIKRAFGEHGLSITSSRLAHGALTGAIYLAFRGSFFEDADHPTRAPINLGEAVGLLKGEIEFLDALGCPPRIFYTGILAMSFIALAVEPSGRDFVQRIAERRGSKIDGKMDPVESISHLALTTELMEPGRASAYQRELFCRALHGFGKWRDSQSGKKRLVERSWTRGILTATDSNSLVTEFRRAKGVAATVDV